MTDEQLSPGPIADHVFDAGFKIAALFGVVASAILYLIGPLSLTNGIHVSTTLLLFPVYLLFIAILLGVWLGYEPDERNLEQTDAVDMDSGEQWERWPW